jgi:hypothetical protein
LRDTKAHFSGKDLSKDVRKEIRSYLIPRVTTAAINGENPKIIIDGNKAYLIMQIKNVSGKMYHSLQVHLKGYPCQSKSTPYIQVLVGVEDIDFIPNRRFRRAMLLSFDQEVTVKIEVGKVNIITTKYFFEWLRLIKIFKFPR